MHLIRKAGKEHSLPVPRKEVNKICSAAKSTAQISRRGEGFTGLLCWAYFAHKGFNAAFLRMGRGGSSTLL